MRRVIASVFLAVLFGLRVVWLDYRLRPIGSCVFGSEIFLVFVVFSIRDGTDVAIPFLHIPSLRFGFPVCSQANIL